MTDLLELREKIKVIYSKYEVFVLPIVKFLLAFLVLNTLNGQLGYMTQLDNIGLVLIVSLACSFLPVGSLVLFATIFSLMHMYALSIEVALVGLCVYLLMFLLFFRISPKESLVVVLTPLLFILKIPYVMPLAMGLLGTPASVASVGCGVAIYYLITTVSTNAPTISTMDAGDATAKLRLVIDGLLNNKAMLITITAFAITVVAVYLLRRMSVDYSWTIAIIAGAMINMLILLMGDLLYDTNISVVGVIIGAVVAGLVGKVIEFFRLCLDYSRTEKVQFEDDEYYYYVKAVPKMSVAAPTKTVKKINAQTRPSTSATQNTVTRNTTTQSTATRNNTTQNTATRNTTTQSTTTRNTTTHTTTTRSTAPKSTSTGSNATRGAVNTTGTGNARRVTTERTGTTTANRSAIQREQSAYNRRNTNSGGRSATINNSNDDYEELF